ncbi:MAG: hypothetical protein WDM76_06250 [Limisphaerales bacterium]
MKPPFPISGRETVLNTVEISGQQPVTLPPFASPTHLNSPPTSPTRRSDARTNRDDNRR